MKKFGPDHGAPLTRHLPRGNSATKNAGATGLEGMGTLQNSAADWELFSPSFLKKAFLTKLATKILWLSEHKTCEHKSFKGEQAPDTHLILVILLPQARALGCHSCGRPPRQCQQTHSLFHSFLLAEPSAALLGKDVPAALMPMGAASVSLPSGLPLCKHACADMQHTWGQACENKGREGQY